jgi:hypothetical protein
VASKLEIIFAYISLNLYHIDRDCAYKLFALQQKSSGESITNITIQALTAISSDIFKYLFQFKELVRSIFKLILITRVCTFEDI